MTSTKRQRMAGWLAVASLTLVALLLVPGVVSSRAFAFVATGFPVGLMALGSLRGGRWGLLGPVLVVLLVLLEGAVAVILLSAGEPAAGGGAFGLPPAAWALLLGLWILPLPLVAVAYALTFDRSGVTLEDLEKLRSRVGSRR